MVLLPVMLICYQSNKEKTMFEISPETKESAIEEMKTAIKALKEMKSGMEARIKQGIDN